MLQTFSPKKPKTIRINVYKIKMIHWQGSLLKCPIKHMKGELVQYPAARDLVTKKCGTQIQRKKTNY